MDREKVIGELEEHIESTLAVHDVYADGIPLGLLQYTVAMLKEQKAQKFFVDESGKITPLPVVVRCKDCNRRGTYDCPVYVGGDGMCSEPDDFFCADGERKVGE